LDSVFRLLFATSPIFSPIFAELGGRTADPEAASNPGRPAKGGTLARRPGDSSKADDLGIRGAPLKPIRFVERELTRPDGTKLMVKVPVYPPFRLEERPNNPPEPRKRKAPRKSAEKKAS
jgi:hypothetical protein